MSSRPVEQWKKGDRVLCVCNWEPYLTKGKYYTLTEHTTYDNGTWFVSVVVNTGEKVDFFADRFNYAGPSTHKEFTDEEYERLLV